MKKSFIILCIGLWIGFILYQGSRSSEVSIELSNKFVNKLVTILHDVFPSSNPVTIYRLIHVLIRKMAHVFEYALLGWYSTFMVDKKIKATLSSVMIESL